ncbi:MAG: T9SS type A sorting domain-containing protein [bacterium]|nr:T9SS type A sorting domain-containing protein [bacterium]
MRLRYLVLLWISVSSAAFAQAPGIDWQHQSGLGSDFEAIGIREVGVGEVVVAGFTDVNFNYDVYVRKFFANGSVEWSTHLSTFEDDQATGISLSAGSGYAVGGWRSLFGGPADIILNLLDSGGSLLNSFTYGAGDDEVANDLQTTSDNGYVLAGYRDQGLGRDFHIIKVTSAGALTWSKTYGGASDDVAHAVLQTSDGGYLVVGETSSFGFGDKDVWVLRLDANGDSLWSSAFLSAETEVGYGVTQTSDGGFAISGYQQTLMPFDQDVLLIKIDASGALLWTTLLDWGGFDLAYDVDECNDNGLVVCGKSDGGSSSEEATVWKFDEIGQHYWTVQVGDASGDGTYEIRQLNAGGYIFCGYTANPTEETIDMLVVKLLPDIDLEGPLPVELLSFGAVSTEQGIELSWTTASETDVDHFELYRGTNGDFLRVAELAATGSASSGQTYRFADSMVERHVDYSYYLTVVDVNGAREELRDRMVTASWHEGAAIPEEFTLRAYPNPFNPTTTIEFTLSEAGQVTLAIFDNTGRTIETLARAANAGTVRFEWNAEGRSSGTYFARVSAAGGSRVVPLVLLK